MKIYRAKARTGEEKMIKTDKGNTFTIETEDYVIKEFQYDINKENGDCYTKLEVFVETNSGLLVARKMHEFWTNRNLDHFYGKNHIFDSVTIFKDDIGYFKN